jgi:hypothetical protein
MSKISCRDAQSCVSAAPSALCPRKERLQSPLYCGPTGPGPSQQSERGLGSQNAKQRVLGSPSPLAAQRRTSGARPTTPTAPPGTRAFSLRVPARKRSPTFRTCQGRTIIPARSPQATHFPANSPRVRLRFVGVSVQPRVCHCEERSDEAISTPRVRDCFAARAMTEWALTPQENQSHPPPAGCRKRTTARFARNKLSARSMLGIGFSLCRHEGAGPVSWADPVD